MTGKGWITSPKTKLRPDGVVVASLQSANLRALNGVTHRHCFSAFDSSNMAAGCDPEVAYTKELTGTLILNISYLPETTEGLVPTNTAWKGTCRVMSVRLQDGSEFIGRMFFK